jgi:N-acetylmuramoyl-L-alanine amidase
MREITYIVVHTSATSQNATVAAIVKYWREKLKWKSPGYHQIIDKDGCVSILAPDNEICNGVAGYNKQSLHVCYIGGIDSNNKPIDNRTDKQKESLLQIITEWKKLYPKATVKGHRDFPNVKKACPCFDAILEYN